MPKHFPYSDGAMLTETNAFMTTVLIWRYHVSRNT